MRIATAIFFVITSVAHAAGFDHTHATWTQWLKKYTTVKGPVTTVDYARSKTEPTLLDKYLAGIEATTRETYDAFNEKDKLAFLINSYNAFTVRWINMNYPTTSIKSTVGLFGNPWKKNFFKFFGEEQNLDGIEHGTIRKDFAEPRIHFAVVCASKGCPQLRGEAFVGKNIEAQLEDNTRSFLKDKERNLYDAAENQLQLSKLFDWYGDDFKKQAGSVQAFVAKRLAANPAEAEKMKEASVKFNDYDWTLNETPTKTIATTEEAKAGQH